jgi:hypothetical protein
MASRHSVLATGILDSRIVNSLFENKRVFTKQFSRRHQRAVYLQKSV